MGKLEIPNDLRAVLFHRNIFHDYDFYCYRREHGDAEAWCAFIRAVNGETNIWSKHIRIHRGRLIGRGWQKLRRAVFARDNYTCVYCGAVDVPLHCDHKIPITRGGSDELDNLVTACGPCNQSKYSKTVEEWRPCPAE